MGQSGWSGEIAGEPYDPLIHGQWSGPYALDDAINPNGNDEWAEIVHIVTLPPPNDGKVLLWAKRNKVKPASPPSTPELITEPYTTWIWSSNNTLVSVPLDNSSDGSNDLFCGAQTLLPGSEGRVLAMGGTDMTYWVTGVVRGTRATYEFNNLPAESGQAAWVEAVPGLVHHRYYNGCLREADGTVHTYGSTGEPNTHIPGETNREEFDSPTWDVRDNYSLPDDDDCSDLSELYAITTGNYPDIHLTGKGDWLRVDGGTTQFFRQDYCMTSPDKDRFIAQDGGDHDPRMHANSAHLFGWGDEPTPRIEAVYAIGGNDSLGCAGEFTNEVVKMVNPDLDVPWISDPPDLNHERHTANTIILLDGSLLTIGGASRTNPGVDPPVCEPVYDVELYRPPEVFETPSSSWKLVAPIFHPRTYHSVAALLPDGSVIAAGGVGTNDPMGEYQPSWHSVEVYKPPYFFSPVRRPVITSAPSSWGYGLTVTITVAFLNEWPDESEGTERRVALVSPCSGTHGVDFNQRYVELDDFSFAPNGGGGVLQVIAPENGGIAPPGMYMLTVVNADGIPSEARWIELN